jgi:hypothetical protein
VTRRGDDPFFIGTAIIITMARAVDVGRAMDDPRKK